MHVYYFWQAKSFRDFHQSVYVLTGECSFAMVLDINLILDIKSCTFWLLGFVKISAFPTDKCICSVSVHMCMCVYCQDPEQAPQRLRGFWVQGLRYRVQLSSLDKSC